MLLTSVFISSTIFAKSMPENMRKSKDGRQLIMQRYDMNGLYTLDSIPSIYLQFNQSDYWSLLTQNYQSKTEIPVDVVYNGVKYSNAGIRFRGQTSYQNVKNSPKKSFNISVDYLDAEQKIDSYKSLNLLNCYEDPSMMREVLYNTLTSYTIPSGKANFIKLYINGESWGLYANVQQLNKDFLEEWFLSNDGANWRAEYPDTSSVNSQAGGNPPGGGTPPGGGNPPGSNNMFGAGVCSLNYISNQPLVYSSYYTLKSSDMKSDPWTALMNSCDKLNNLDNDLLYDSLKKYLDVDRALWHIANEIIFTDDDSYINKGGMDYYIYFDAETSRLTPIQYDANSTFETNNVNWSPYLKETDAKFPLANKLLANPALKQRYTAHLRTIMNKYLNSEFSSPLIDKYNTLISSEVASDTKKIYSVSQYNTAITDIKNFTKNRKNNLLKNAIVAAEAPSISNVDFTSSLGQNLNPNSSEQIKVNAKVASGAGISKVLLYYGTGLMGTFEYTEMYDDGNHNDGTASDGIYGGTIPAFEVGAYVRYYIEARSANTYNSSAFSPEGAEHDVYYYQIIPKTQEQSLIVVNEVSPSNKTVTADPQGDYDDWIELYNNGNSDYDLTGHYLSDKEDNPKKWQFPDNTIIKAHDYLLIFADEDSNDNPNGIHTNFKLSGEGEVVMLSNTDANNNEIMDIISFPAVENDKTYGRYPNGTGDFILMTATPLTENINSGLSVDEQFANDALVLYPNPFSGSVSINLMVSKDDYYNIGIYDLNGSKISDISNSYLNIGEHIFNWNANNIIGTKISQGVYTIRISNSVSVITKQLIYLGI